MVKKSNTKMTGVLKPDRSLPKLDRPALEKVAAIFFAFADATRLAIIQELRQGPRSVGELVEALGTSQANISKHLKLMHQASLLVRERQGMQVYYHVAESSIFEVCQFACKRLHGSSQAVSAEDYFI